MQAMRSIGVSHLARDLYPQLRELCDVFLSRVDLSEMTDAELKDLKRQSEFRNLKARAQLGCKGFDFVCLGPIVLFAHTFLLVVMLPGCIHCLVSRY